MINWGGSRAGLGSDAIDSGFSYTDLIDFFFHLNMSLGNFPEIFLKLFSPIIIVFCWSEGG